MVLKNVRLDPPQLDISWNSPNSRIFYCKDKTWPIVLISEFIHQSHIWNKAPLFKVFWLNDFTGKREALILLLCNSNFLNRWMNNLIKIAFNSLIIDGRISTRDAKPWNRSACPESETVSHINSFSVYG